VCCIDRLNPHSFVVDLTNGPQRCLADLDQISEVLQALKSAEHLGGNGGATRFRFDRFSL
jgi:hypothetical protein